MSQSQVPKSSKHKFTDAEDRLIAYMVGLYGTQSWAFISESFSQRTGRQIRERWTNYLDPNVNRGPWTEDEDKLILHLYKAYGPKWTKIAKEMKNRTDVAIKNRYALLMRKQNFIEKTVPQKDIFSIFTTDETFFDFFNETISCDL